MTYTILAGVDGHSIRKLTGYLVTGLFERADAIAACRANQPGFVLARQGKTL